MKPYRPSNGTEGDCFMSAFCFNGCKHFVDDSQDDLKAGFMSEKTCDIIGRTFAFSISDPEYPKEWVQNDDGSSPRCTAFALEGEPDITPRCEETLDMFERK